MIRNTTKSSKDNIMVSICCITYNHASFVEQTLQSFEAQEVDFSIEIIIHDDCSKDATRDKLITFKKTSKYPVTLLFPEENRYSKGERIFLKTFIKAKGTYIATCEGDDYWLSPTKLKEQVDFLEKNKNYNLITGSIKQYFEENKIFDEAKERQPYSFTYKDLILRNHSPTCATLFRNNINSHYKVIDGMGTDSQYWIRALGKTGKGHHTGKIEAIYRRHENSLSANAKRNRKEYKNLILACKQKIIKAKFWNNYFGGEAKKELNLVKHKFTKRMLSHAVKRFKIFDIIQFALLFLFLKLKK